MLSIHGSKIARFLAGTLLLGSLLYLASRPELPQAQAWHGTESVFTVQAPPPDEPRILFVRPESEAHPRAPTPIEPPPFEPSRIVLELVGAEGQPLSDARCELLLRSWYGVERVELATQGNLLEVPLDADWLADQWTTGTRHVHGRILIQAPGHATLCSYPSRWIGAPDMRGTPTEEALIRFPREQEFEVARGETIRGRVVLRRPEPRSLTLVDADGAPVPGIGALLYMHWSHENHCGVLSGIEDLGWATSDEYGTIVLPDGDYEYAFMFRDLGDYEYRFMHQGRRWILDPPMDYYAPMRWIGWLQEETTTIQFRRRDCGPLRLRVTRGGLPATDFDLYVNIGWAGCGATWGRAGQPDDEGRIQLEDVWYEGLDRMWLQDAAGEELWSTDPRELDRQTELLVELP